MAAVTAPAPAPGASVGRGAQDAAVAVGGRPVEGPAATTIDPSVRR